MTAPTRRAALSALAGFPALALSAAAMASPAVLAAQIADPSAAPAKQEAEGLIEIGRRMPDLLDEFWKASAALNDARAQFDETAPLPPKPRKRANDETKRIFKNGPPFKIVRDLSGNAPLEVGASHAYESLYDAWSRDGAGGITRKEFYQVSDRYQWKLFSAASDCGLADALTRFRKADHELREVAAQAFDFRPETRLGIAAQALALCGAFAAQDGRVGSKFAGELAVSLLQVEAQLSHGDMSVLLSPADCAGRHQHPLTLSARAAGQPA